MCYFLFVTLYLRATFKTVSMEDGTFDMHHFSSITYVVHLYVTSMYCKTNMMLDFGPYMYNFQQK